MITHLGPALGQHGFLWITSYFPHGPQSRNIYSENYLDKQIRHFDIDKSMQIILYYTSLRWMH